jgi:flagellar motor component MotA
LVRYASRKKKRREENIIMQETVEQSIEGKLSKNWKSRRKKTLDKEEWVNIISLSLKEMNQLKERIKIVRK